MAAGTAPAPQSAVRLQQFLETLNLKGVATRSDLLGISSSSTELDSWLRDLISTFGFVEERETNSGRKHYTKTLRGRTMEQVLTTYWPGVKVLLYGRPSDKNGVSTSMLCRLNLVRRPTRLLSC